MQLSANEGGGDEDAGSKKAPPRPIARAAVSSRPAIEAALTHARCQDDVDEPKKAPPPRPGGKPVRLRLM